MSETEGSYDEHFTAFVDLLGFAEASSRVDDTTRLKVLHLLMSMSELQGDFSKFTRPGEKAIVNAEIRPAISTFSDHIVISWPLHQVTESVHNRRAALDALNGFGRLLAKIAAQALQIGFLIRGGAAIEKLHHANRIVFGKAMVDAYNVESQSAVYPRVVVTYSAIERLNWADQPGGLIKGRDGLWYIDYYGWMVGATATNGVRYADEGRAWFRDAVETIRRNLVHLEQTGRLKELAKCVWFCHEFRHSLERSPALHSGFGISLDSIPRPRVINYQ